MNIDGKNFNFNELAQEISINELKGNKEKLAQIFSLFDMNNDKKLSGDELKNTFSIFSQMDNTKGVADKALTDDEIYAGKSKFVPETMHVSVYDIKSFIISIATLTTGKSVASKIHKQISGASLNKNTLEKLKDINKDNVVEVIQEYSKLSPEETLASAIDNEWGLNIEDVKIKVCKPLVERAKASNVKGIYYKQYMEIDNIKDLNNFINTTVTKINKVETEAKVKASKISGIEDLIKTEVAVYDNVINKEKDVDYEYWSKLIYKAAEKYDVPTEILVSIIAKETGGVFKKNENNDT